MTYHVVECYSSRYCLSGSEESSSRLWVIFCGLRFQHPWRRPGLQYFLCRDFLWSPRLWIKPGLWSPPISLALALCTIVTWVSFPFYERSCLSLHLLFCFQDSFTFLNWLFYHLLTKIFPWSTLVTKVLRWLLRSKATGYKRGLHHLQVLTLWIQQDSKYCFYNIEKFICIQNILTFLFSLKI